MADLTTIPPLETQPENIKDRAKQYAEQAAIFKVETSEDYALAIDVMRRLKTMRKAWDELQRPAIRAAKAAHEEALKVFKSIDGELETAFDTLKDRCEAWVQARRLAQQAALKATSAAMIPTPQTTEAALGPEFDAAVAAGDTAKASRILDQAAMPVEIQPLAPPPPPPTVDTYIPKMPGVALTTPYTWDLLDEDAIPREYMTPDRKKISAVVKAMKDKTNIPGIRVRPDTGLTVRG